MIVKNWNLFTHFGLDSYSMLNLSMTSINNNNVWVCFNLINT